MCALGVDFIVAIFVLATIVVCAFYLGVCMHVCVLMCEKKVLLDKPERKPALALRPEVCTIL